MEIEHELKQRASLKKIAEKIGKHHSSISREILARRTPSSKGAFGRITNRCISRGLCNRRQLCMDKPDCTRRCSTCRACNALCPDFVEQICSKLAAPPYVCNGCADEAACVLHKFYYLHKLAHCTYREILTGSREGANITEEELISLDELVSPLIRQGQSLHHILVNNPDCFTMNDKTLYRYVAGRLLQAKNGDMPRVCRLKPRAGKPVEHKVDTGCRIGRTYADYLSFMATAPDLRAVEMDSVIGRVGGKVLLTLMFPWCGLMLAFLRNRNDSQSVIDAFSHLWNRTGPELYRRLFAVLLGDNGSEFSNPKALELDPDLAEVHYQSAVIAQLVEWDWGKSEKEFLKSLAINPNNPLARLMYAQLLLILNRDDESLAQRELALSLDPLNLVTRILYIGTLVQAGDFKASIPLMEEALAANPEDINLNGMLELAAYMSKDNERAVKALKYSLPFPFEKRRYLEIERIYKESGIVPAYSELIKYMEQYGENNYIGFFDMTFRYIIANQPGRAMDWVEKGFKSHDPLMAYITRSGHVLEPLFENPRFIDICKKMNLTLSKSEVQN